MKKSLLTLFLISFVNLFPQNLQIHYDLGESRQYITTTIEMFRPDDYGSTFFFVDFDYNLPGINSNRGISLAYLEFARYMTVYEKFAVTVQYNDGVGITSENFGFTLNQTLLAGISYTLDLGFVALNTDLLGRVMSGSASPDGQLTIVWLVSLFEGQVHFTGFFDIWTQDKVLNNSEIKDKKLVLLTEPQIWYNLTTNLSAGTEIEISNNFVPDENKLEVNPTVAVKWNF